MVYFQERKSKALVGIILAPSVTTIGLVLGFTPVISFFFANALNDDRKELKSMKKSFPRASIRKQTVAHGRKYLVG